MNNPMNVAEPKEELVRKFDTGAIRSSDAGKHDYVGYLSPFVIKRFAEYMTSHRIQSDGKPRQSDNWKKGMSTDVYIRSLFRHFMDLWLLHEGEDVFDIKDGHQITSEEACCALLFNVQGYLHELLILFTEPLTIPEFKAPEPAPNKLKTLLSSMGLATK